MEINKVSAIYPVNRVNSSKKDNRADDKRKNEEKTERNFENTLLTKKREDEAVDEKV